MKIAVTSVGPTIDHCVVDRVNNSEYSLVVDLNTIQYKVVQNLIGVLQGSIGRVFFSKRLLRNKVIAVLAGGFDSDIHELLDKKGTSVVVGAVGLLIVLYRVLCSVIVF